MKDALKSSLSSEKTALEARFEKAENVLALTEMKKSRASQPERPQVIRRTFSLTKDDYDTIVELKRRCNLQGFEAPQSQIIRAGIHRLAALSESEFQAAIEQVEKLKPGRTSD